MSVPWRDGRTLPSAERVGRRRRPAGAVPTRASSSWEAACVVAEMGRARAPGVPERETADGGCHGAAEPMKDVARLREAAGSRLAGRDPRMSEWGNPAGAIPRSHHQVGGRGGERKHLSTSRTEINRDPRSSGERNGTSPNARASVAGRPMVRAGWTAFQGERPLPRRVSKPSPSRRTLGGAAVDGESPVGERGGPRGRCVSTTGHEEPGGKPGRPRSKAKEPRRPIVDSTVRER